MYWSKYNLIISLITPCFFNQEHFIVQYKNLTAHYGQFINTSYAVINSFGDLWYSTTVSNTMLDRAFSTIALGSPSGRIQSCRLSLPSTTGRRSCISLRLSNIFATFQKPIYHLYETFFTVSIDRSLLQPYSCQIHNGAGIFHNIISPFLRMNSV